MTSDDFHTLCMDVSRLAVNERGRIGSLRLLQKRNNELTIREPEMRHAFCRTIDSRERPADYGIEVPTAKTYRFVEREGVLMRKALHDLVLYEVEAADVLIELKTGQPGGENSPKIGKDLQKLLREAANGKAMFHVCHASHARTLPALIRKYDAALRSTLDKIAAMSETPDTSGWLELFVLVLYDREAGWEPHLHRYTLPPSGDAFVPNPGGKVPIPRA